MDEISDHNPNHVAVTAFGEMPGPEKKIAKWVAASHHNADFAVWQQTLLLRGDGFIIELKRILASARANSAHDR